MKQPTKGGSLLPRCKQMPVKPLDDYRAVDPLHKQQQQTMKCERNDIASNLGDLFNQIIKGGGRKRIVTRELTLNLTEAEFEALNDLTTGARKRRRKIDIHLAADLESLEYKVRDSWVTSKTPMQDAEKTVNRAFMLAVVATVALVTIAGMFL